MDPNATLAEIREILATAAELDNMSDRAADRLAELFTALDDWLSSGGFLPGAWTR